MEDSLIYKDPAMVNEITWSWVIGVFFQYILNILFEIFSVQEKNRGTQKSECNSDLC